jgi:hypothetical protein
MRAFAVVLALAALADAWDVVSTLVGWNDEPWVIVVIHCLVFILAAAASLGLWRSARWAAAAVVLWGVAVAAFVVGLGPILGLDSAARGGLWVGGSSLLIFAFVVAAYARRHVRVPAA